VLAASQWAAGCATAPRPMIDPGFAARAYTPGRIAILPPDVFVILDQVGDNDPVKSAALGQAVSAETVRAIERSLRSRGYDVDLSARWDGIYGADGAPMVSAGELGELARGIVRFASSAEGGQRGAIAVPAQVAPELAARVGWATQSDAVLYVNVKGVVTTPGRQTATVLAAVFIVVIVAAIVLVLASQKGGGGGRGLHPGSGGSHPAGGGNGWRAAPPVGSAARSPAGAAMRPPMGSAVRPPVGSAVTSSAWHPGPAAAPRGVAPAPPIGGWRGGGRPPGALRGGHVFVGTGLDVGIIVPLDEPVYTHDGSIGYDDPVFAGDELYVSMTLVSTYDGRVLWHARDALDLEANNPAHVDRMVQAFVDTLPPALPPPPPPASQSLPPAGVAPRP
jgi:hypothetical protein